MKKWMKTNLWKIATGVLVTGVAAGTLINASELGNLFQPEKFRQFDNIEEAQEYDYVAGEGETSDLADQDKNGENRTKEKQQQALQVAQETQPETEPDANTLGVADQQNHAGESENRNAIDLTPDTGNTRQTDESNRNTGTNNTGNGNRPGGGTTDSERPTPDTNGNRESETGDNNNRPSQTEPETEPATDPVPTPTPTPAPTDPTETNQTETNPPETDPDQGQLQPADPVVTEDGRLIDIQVLMIRTEYAYGDRFSPEDAVVTAIFQKDGERVEKVLQMGDGTSGYTVSLLTNGYGERSALFTYRNMSVRAQYVVLRKSAVICFEARTDGDDRYYTPQFPGPDKEGTEILGASEYADAARLNKFPYNFVSSGNVVNLTEAHRKMIAYLGDARMEAAFRKITSQGSYKDVVFLTTDAQGYLTTMLTGFRAVQSNLLTDTRSYLYYPYSGWAETSRNVLDYVDTVPAGCKIRRVTDGYDAEQVLTAYTGTDTSLSVPMGTTQVALEQKAEKVTSMKIPESVQKIDQAALGENLPALQAYEYASKDDQAGLQKSGYLIEDGILYSSDGKTLVSVPAGRKQVTIPARVTTLEKGCFTGMASDAVITFEGESAPSRKGSTGFCGTIQVADSQYDLVRKSYLFAFEEECDQITFVTGQDTQDPYRYVEEGPVLCRKGEDGQSSTLLAIPQNTVGGYQLTGVEAADERSEGGNRITTIGSYAFAGCNRLTNLELGEQVTELEEGSLVFSAGVKNVILDAESMEIAPMLFGDPEEGYEVPDIHVYVRWNYDAYLKQWSEILDPVYGSGTAERLLQEEAPEYIYEDGAVYQLTRQDGQTTYQMVHVYQTDCTFLKVKEGTTAIRRDALEGCDKLEILILPESFKEKKEADFGSLTALESVVSEAADQVDLDEIALPSGAAFLQAGREYTAFSWQEHALYGEQADGTSVLLNVATDQAGIFTVRKNTAELADEALEDCSQITEILLEEPTALNTIGSEALKGCTQITALNLEACERLTRIGSAAFENCTALTEVICPASVKELEDKLFRMDSGLVNVTASGVTVIGNDVFYRCEVLENIHTSGAETRIGDRAFYGCRTLNKIVFPETLESVGESCFENCINVTEVNINGKLTNIGRYCFTRCENLRTVTFEGEVKNTLRVIGVQAFAGCMILENMDLSELTALTQIGQEAFAANAALTKVVFPEGLQQLPEGCFSGCPVISVVQLKGQKVVTLGEQVFGPTLPQYVHILVEENMVDTCIEAYRENLDATYGEGTTERILGKIEEGVEYLGGVKFANTEEGRVLLQADQNLTEIYIVPIDVVRIEADAFAGCNQITRLIIQSGAKLSLGDRCMKGCTGLQTLSIYGIVTDWGEETFMDCTALSSVYINASPTETIERIGTRAFKGCTGLREATSVAIAGPVRVFGEECFADCSNLPTVAFGSTARVSLQVLEDRVFQNCVSMTAFLTSSFRGMQRVGAYVFQNCDSLKNPSVPANVTSVGEGCFMDCDNIQTVSFYGALAEYPKNCFRNCPKLTRTGGTAAAFSGLKRIGESAYEGCVSLNNYGTSWYLGKYTALQEVGERAFYGCKSLASSTLAATVTQIGNGAFDGCISMPSLTIKATQPPKIGTMAFSGMQDGFRILVPDSEEQGDVVYLAYLKYLTDRFGEEKALEVLDSETDGARQRHLEELLSLAELETESETEMESETEPGLETETESETEPQTEEISESEADTGDGTESRETEPESSTQNDTVQSEPETAASEGSSDEEESGESGETEGSEAQQRTNAVQTEIQQWTES